MMRAWIVSTPDGDWRDIYAVSADDAKRRVWQLTLGRVPLSSMWATVQD